MKLSYEQILSVAFGYESYIQDEKGIRLYHMRTEHAAFISSFNEIWGIRAHSGAGIYLDFYTDSSYFGFAYDQAVEGSSQIWYYFEILIDGKSVALIGEYDTAVRQGEHRIQLPTGTHHVTLVFPNMFNARLTKVELSDGASLSPAVKKGKLVFYGDSITQGYHSKMPALCYVHRIGVQTDYEAFNLGVGGAIFDPRLIDMQTFIRPDAVFVAYGTNDWMRVITPEDFTKNVRAFLDALKKLYPTQPIFVILPIWRVNCQAVHSLGTLLDARKLLCEIANGYEKVKLIDLWEDIPQEATLFSDGLHPNEQGFAFYADGVYKQIKGALL